jgi:hypothetical protein
MTQNQLLDFASERDEQRESRSGLPYISTTTGTSYLCRFGSESSPSSSSPAVPSLAATLLVLPLLATVVAIPDRRA